MNNNPIALDSELCQTLTCLPEKFIVDFASGIDVVRDHTRTQKDQSFMDRFLSGLTGNDVRRQQSVNASLADGIEGSLRWLTELTKSVVKSNLAISQVSERVNNLMQHTATIVSFSVDTRQKLEFFQKELESFQEEINRINIRLDGKSHVDAVMNRWKAGKFQQFSLAGRAYVALEELRWGAFGDLLRESDEQQVEKLLDDLINQVVTQLVHDTRTDDKQVRYPAEYWLQGTGDTLFRDGLAFLGNHYSGRYHPIVFATTQTGQDLPLGMPMRCTAKRLAEAMVREVFEEA